jgi:hypothetical protein
VLAVHRLDQTLLPRRQIAFLREVKKKFSKLLQTELCVDNEHKDKE